MQAFLDLFLGVHAVGDHQQHAVELGQDGNHIVRTQHWRQVKDHDARAVAIAQIHDQLPHRRRRQHLGGQRDRFARRQDHKARQGRIDQHLLQLRFVVQQFIEGFVHRQPQVATHLGTT
ncbi:hypothetical protein D3C76_1421230 [compost metagenome]